MMCLEVEVQDHLHNIRLQLFSLEVEILHCELCVHTMSDKNFKPLLLLCKLGSALRHSETKLLHEYAHQSRDAVSTATVHEIHNSESCSFELTSAKLRFPMNIMYAPSHDLAFRVACCRPGEDIFFKGAVVRTRFVLFPQTSSCERSKYYSIARAVIVGVNMFTCL